MMKRMRQKLRTGAVFLLLCTLIGCGKTEQEFAERFSADATEAWVEESYAKSGEIDGTEQNDKMQGLEAIIVESEAVEPRRPSTDAADIPESTEVLANDTVNYEFTASDKDYFSDALFIGDSRTVGLQLYGTLDNADYFATPGLSLYTIPRTKVTIGEYEDITLEELLEKKDYGKIYLMLGINELGYNFDTTVEKYNELVSQLRMAEPDAVLYVCANLHVTITRHENDEIHNNDSINKINAEIAKLADRKDIFYLDVNTLFDDEAGNLNEEYTSDDSHVLGTYYEEWCNWLGDNTIVKE